MLYLKLLNSHKAFVCKSIIHCKIIMGLNLLLAKYQIFIQWNISIAFNIHCDMIGEGLRLKGSHYILSPETENVSSIYHRFSVTLRRA